MTGRGPIPAFAGALALTAALSLGGPGATPAGATEVQIFKTETRAGFLNGESEGISIDPLGRLGLAQRVERLSAVEEPFLLSMARHPEGWVLGTGNAGRVLLVTDSGEVRQLFEAPEPQVFAVWASADGTVYAGTSPRGRVYRFAADGSADGATEPEPFFDPGEVYIWAFAEGPDGELLVATGTDGRLYAVDPATGEGSVRYDGEDTHIRSLAVTDGGEILLGTAGEGLILALSRDGSARTLYDADAPEVAALVPGPDGSAFAALVASEASLVDLSGGGNGGNGSGNGETGVEGSEGDGTGTVSGEAGSVSLGSRSAGFGGPRSTVVTIRPGGLVEPLATLDTETVFSLLWRGARLWLGTGLDGKLYAVTPEEGQPVLEQDVDERQIVALGAVRSGTGPVFATTNAAAVYRSGGGDQPRGVYVSEVLDAEEIARFGIFRWVGEGEGSVRFSFRSGISRSPDRTWSEWTPWRSGREVSLADVPRGRYVQWRAELTRPRGGSGGGPSLSSVELSYLQDNLAPEIESFEVLGAGQILVPSNFNPGTQAYEPVSPNREGIFTRLESAARETDGRLKELWKKGWRTLRWSTEDPNEDEVEARIEFAREAETEPGWLPMAEDLDEGYYSFDATALPDGVYRFRLTVTDAPGNRPEDERATHRVSEPVVVDHTAPRLVTGRGVGARSHRVEDALSPLTRAEVSFDAGEWHPAATADGLLDGRAETFEIQPPDGARLVLLRVMDAAFNVVTFDLSGSVEGGS